MKLRRVWKVPTAVFITVTTDSRSDASYGIDFPEGWFGVAFARDSGGRISTGTCAAIALIQDLSAAMIMQARAGAPLAALKNKAIRNAELVMFEGKASLADIDPSVP